MLLDFFFVLFSCWKSFAHLMALLGLNSLVLLIPLIPEHFLLFQFARVHFNSGLAVFFDRILKCFSCSYSSKDFLICLNISLNSFNWSIVKQYPVAFGCRATWRGVLFYSSITQMCSIACEGISSLRNIEFSCSSL